MKRVCILTGGGDAPGLNAVLRAFAKRSAQLGIEVRGSRFGFEGLLADALIPLDAAAVAGILPRGGSILGCSNKVSPFSSPETVARVVERIREERLDALVLVGGDGTMGFARRFIALGVPCIGIPKTIDNDLDGTDQTFGYDTAVSTATWAIDNLHSTAEAHERVMILEVMGRTAGWIALAAGISGGADVILIPEIPYDVDRVIAKVQSRRARGRSFTIVVVAEGARPTAAPDAAAKIGGAGVRLARELEGRVDHEIRVTVLGHLQRGGTPSAYDRFLGTRMGVHAADLCAQGRYGRLVVLRGNEITSIELERVSERPRLVDPLGELCRTARATGIELGAPDA